jgi:hypothetical protein
VLHVAHGSESVHLVRPLEEFRGQPPEFWALTKLVSSLLGYSDRRRSGQPSRPKRYGAAEIADALVERGLDPSAAEGQIATLVAYSNSRAELLETIVEPNLMDREAAYTLFEEIRRRVEPPESLLSMNKHKGEKRHYAYLASIVNMLTYETLLDRFGRATFNPNPRGPLTFERNGLPLRTLFRWMDGAYPDVNHPYAAWEVKEYYGTKTFGSRVADGVYETALDGYELNDLRDAGVTVEHYLFLDDHFTWWECGKSYLCRIIDMLHADLLDGAFFGREVVSEWPTVVSEWPDRSSPT